MMEISKTDELKFMVERLCSKKGLEKIPMMKKARNLLNTFNRADMLELCQEATKYNKKEINMMIGLGLKEPARTTFIEQYCKLLENKDG